MADERLFDFTCSHGNCEHKGSYRLRVKCRNCGVEGVGVYTKGHRADPDECPICETTSVSPVIPVELVTDDELVAEATT